MVGSVSSTNSTRPAPDWHAQTHLAPAFGPLLPITIIGALIALTGSLAAIVIVAAVALTAIIYGALWTRATTLKVTPHGIEISRGVFRRKFRSFPLSKVTDVEVHQTSTGARLGYGAVIVCAGRNDRFGISGVIDPYEARNQILSATAQPAPA